MQGPYIDKKEFWGIFFTRDCLKEEYTNLGGDLNFVKRRVEICGDVAKMDPPIDYFVHNIEEVRLCDVQPISLVPTWRNKRARKEECSKRLDHFLVSKKLMKDSHRIKHWVGNRGFSRSLPHISIGGEERKQASWSLQIQPNLASR